MSGDGPSTESGAPAPRDPDTPVGSGPLGPAARLLYRLIRGAILSAAKLLGRVEVHGAERIPADRPFVLAPVHRSNVDFALVALVTRRRLRYMVKDSIWRSRALGGLVSFLGGFPVSRGTADREALRTCLGVIAAGEPLVMFPEGTRRSGPVVSDLFDGPAYVATRAGVPVVPVGIGGSERMMPKGAKFVRPSKLVLVVGQPLDPPAMSTGGRVPRRAVRALTEELRGAVQALFDDAQRRAGVREEAGSGELGQNPRGGQGAVVDRSGARAAEGRSGDGVDGREELA